MSGDHTTLLRHPSAVLGATTSRGPRPGAGNGPIGPLDWRKTFAFEAGC
jgi:hypothetical protein